MSTFHELCNSPHQGEDQSDTELFIRVIPFILSYLEWWGGGGKEGDWGEGGGGGGGIGGCLNI